MASSHRTILSAMLGNLFLFGLILGLFGPSNLKIMEEFDANFTYVGIAVSAQSLGAMLSFFTGGLSDKYGSYNTTKWCMFGLGFSTMLMGLSPNIIFLFAFSFFAGIFFGTYNASSNQVIYGLYPGSSTKMLNIVLVSFGIGVTIGPTTVAAIISYFNTWRIGYVVFGSILMAFTLFQFRFTMADKKYSTISSGGKSSNHLFLMLFVALFFFSIFTTGITSWLPTYIVKANKASYLEAGIILSSFWAGVTLIRLFSWKVSDRLGEEKSLAIFCFLGFIIGSLSIFVTGFLPNAIVWGSMSMSHALVWPLTTTIIYLRYPKSPGKRIGQIISLSTIGSLIAAPLIGTISDVVNLDAATLVIPLSSLVIALVYFWLDHSKKDRQIV